MSVIKLLSSDGEEFEVDVEIAKCSTIIEDMLMVCNDDESVPRVNVTSVIFRKIIEWATHHKDDLPSTTDDEKRTDNISTWDANFLQAFNQETLFELMLAANFLAIKGLLDLTCKSIANMIKGKTVKEIQKTFNIKCDFTPMEKERLRKEHEWCEDK